MSDRPGPQKDADAYRTISEVADELKLPQHVLRFWETRFPQVKPLKRAGGRRFYRPEDVALLRAVQALLYDEGYTIKGVQRLIAEFGARHVADALARSRAPAPPVETPGAVPAVRSHDGGGGGEDMADDEAARPARPVFQPARPAPAGPAPAPRATAQPPAAAPLRAGAPEALAARLTDVLADLSECARLLASARTTVD